MYIILIVIVITMLVMISTYSESFQTTTTCWDYNRQTNVEGNFCDSCDWTGSLYTCRNNQGKYNMNSSILPQCDAYYGEKLQNCNGKITCYQC